jgi:hypothetical protein
MPLTITIQEARARYLGKRVVTSYGTGPYLITHVAVIDKDDDGNPCCSSISLTGRKDGEKTDSYLNGYRLDGTNTHSDDTITVLPDATESFLADNPDGPPAPARVLVKVGDQYYPAHLSPGYDQLGDWRGTPEFDRLVTSALKDGKFQQRLLGKLTTNHRTGFDEFEIEDGRHRFWAAEIAGLHHVEADLTAMPFAELAVRSLCERLHMTKGARAYLVWPLLAPVVEANKEERKAKALENLKKVNEAKKQKGQPTESGLNQLSVESTLSEIANDEIPEAVSKSLVKLAADYGIEKTLLDQARRVHEIFARRKDLKAENEPLILAGDIGMGAYLAGIAGREATEGKKRQDADALTLLSRGFKDLSVRFAKWDTIPDELRAKAASAAVDHVITAWPADVRNRLKLALS